MNAEKHYRFAAIADVHIDRENGGKNIYFHYAEENFARALDTIKELGCRFIISAGDQITNASGGTDEWRRYREIIDRSGYTGEIFEAPGNHETRYAQYGCTLEESLAEFIKYTRLNEKPVAAPRGKTYYEYLDPVFGDSFLFMALENGARTNLIDNFTADQMDWAESTVARRTAEGRRIFLIQHANIFGFGAGDDAENPAYAGAMRMSGENGAPFCGNRRFKKLTERYKDVIWLSGHTHVDFADDVNFTDNGGESCHMLHIPALAGTTRIVRCGDGTSALDRTFRPHVAQGYIADVYADRVTFRAVNLYDGTPYPKYIYTVRRNSS